MKIDERKIIDLASRGCNFKKMSSREYYRIGYFSNSEMELRHLVNRNSIENIDYLENILYNNGISDYGLSYNRILNNYNGVRFYYPLSPRDYKNLIEINSYNDSKLSEDELKYKYNLFSKEEKEEYINKKINNQCEKNLFKLVKKELINYGININNTIEALIGDNKE